LILSVMQLAICNHIRLHQSQSRAGKVGEKPKKLKKPFQQSVARANSWFVFNSQTVSIRETVRRE